MSKPKPLPDGPANELTSSLQRWAKLKKRVDRVNTIADLLLEPHLAAFEKKAEPINAERDEKLQPLLKEMEEIEQQLRETMLASVKADGTSPLKQIETDDAVARIDTERRRQIDTAAFIRAVPPRMRMDPAYIGCLSVLVGAADKFLPAQTLRLLVRPKLTHSIAVTLKSE